MYIEPFEVIACKQNYKEDKNLSLKLLEELGIQYSFKMRVLNWHDNFDALIGTKDLRMLNALLNYEEKTLTLEDIIIPFSLAYNKPLTKPILGAYS